MAPVYIKYVIYMCSVPHTHKGAEITFKRHGQLTSQMVWLLVYRHSTSYVVENSARLNDAMQVLPRILAKHDVTLT